MFLGYCRYSLSKSQELDYRAVGNNGCTPSLPLFKYKGLYPLECDMENLSSLAYAAIDIYGFYQETCAICMSKIIQGVFKAEVLTLSESCFLLLSKDPNILELLPIPTSNLKCLKLTASLEEFDHIKAISRLLKSYINLETRHRCSKDTWLYPKHILSYRHYF